MPGHGRLPRTAKVGWLGRASIGAVVGVAVWALAVQVWAQETQPRERGERERPTRTEPSVETPTLPDALYPLEMLGLLLPSAGRGGVTLTPSIGVSEEYNDNVFLDNENRRSDFITAFTPGILLTINRPTYELGAGYSFTSEIYARESSLNEPFARHAFIASGLYRASPTVTLSVNERFTYDRNTTTLTTAGFAVGRQESWSNSFTPGIAWQMTPRNNLSVTATHSILRFEGGGTGIDSDTYALQSFFGHAFTPRFTGLLGYGFTYLDSDVESMTHTPAVGFSYDITPTLTGTIVGGPAITQFVGDNETIISPAGSARLVQRFQFGTASVEYSRSVRAAGGLGGVTDSQLIAGTLTVSNLFRNLFLALRPAYTIAESLSSGEGSQLDVKTLTVSLVATYQLAPYFNVFGGYTFLNQRTGSSSAGVDVDQNRVRFGLQFGYPFHFD